MLGKIIFVVSALGLVGAQIPSLGWCPDYVPMANFDMNRFLGVWYEAERYFQLSEVVARCVTTNYTKGPDGKLRVSNEVTNRFTGIKRILEGEIKPAASKAEEGKLHVKYTTVPLTPETQYSVLETDYDSYAVLWGCSGIGPVHTQNAWLMTRERSAPGTVLQKAYGVLDKYKISKTFFVKTDQADCAYLNSKPSEAAEPAEKPESEEPEKEEAAKQVNLRSAITPDAPEIILQTRKAEEMEKAEAVKSEPEVEAAVEEETAPVKEEEIKAEPVPEVILKVADQVAEENVEKIADSAKVEPEPEAAMEAEKSES
ncbi:apolipoprotein D [Cephus cinctus]|uniref:Apolipoprotein D n=1 Tax=Cephus cinctus TaxID=211228 RepID=A0AAJ7FNU6_CEPCN|nr:apolipoprotein D [Cephus cinctus]